MTAKINLKKSLRVALASKSMRQKDLAELMGCTVGYISNIGTKGDISVSKLQAICDKLEIKASAFIALGED